MPDDRHIPLALHELDFYAMGDHVHTNTYEPRQGLWAEMVRLARGFRHIQDLHRRYADGELNTGEVETLTGQLSAEIDDFINLLPPQYRLTEQNLNNMHCKAWDET
jgi:hypothetical protein